jgi:predicted metal-dependent phosphoesterase TrpH
MSSFLILIGIQFLIFILCVIIIIGISIFYAYNLRNHWDYSANTWSWRFPVKEITKIQFNVLIDQHAHTTITGGNLSLRQSIRWHIANGFNAMVMTEHNRFNSEELIDEVQKEFEGQFILIQGMEWTTDRIHINFLDLKHWDEPIPQNPSDEEIQHAIQIAHDQSALVTVNHPTSQREKAADFPTFDQLLEWGVDYIEVQGQNIYEEDAVKFCQRSGLGMITGTDIHFPIPVNGWTALNVKEFTRDAILEELHARNTQIFYDKIGSPDYTIRDIPQNARKWIPFIALGQLFAVTDHSQLRIKWNIIGKTLTYLIGIFLCTQLLWWGLVTIFSRI